MGLDTDNDRQQQVDEFISEEEVQAFISETSDIETLMSNSATVEVLSWIITTIGVISVISLINDQGIDFFTSVFTLKNALPTLMVVVGACSASLFRDKRKKFKQSLDDQLKSLVVEESN